MKKFLTVLTAAVCFIVGCSLTACSGETQTETVHISSVDDLLLLSDSKNKVFVFDNDIDCGGKKFTGIQNFEGNIDGNGYVIKNIEIISSNNCYGLISTIGGTYGKEYKIENLGLENFTINVTASNENTYVGGIVGFDQTGVTIRECYTCGEINLLAACTGCYAVGGILGSGETFKIDNSYSNANIIVNHSTKLGNKGYYLGGILGYAHQWGGTIKNCYFSGSIDSSEMTLTESVNYTPRIGSIIGKADDNDTVEYCVGVPTRLVGNTQTNKGYMGGIIGSYSGVLHTFRYNYYLDNYKDYMGEEDYSYYAPMLTSTHGKAISNTYKNAFLTETVWTGNYYTINGYGEQETINLNFDTSIWQFGGGIPRLKVFNHTEET